MAVGLAVLWLDYGWTTSALAVAILGGVVLIFYVLGRISLGRWPYVASLPLESGLFLLMLGAGVAGAVLVLIAISFKPDEHSTVREKELYAAVAAAIATYLGGVIIKPEGDKWNPVKNAVKSAFKDKFRSRRDDVEKDASDAVNKDFAYTSLAHNNEVVKGWNWADRRLRARHIQRAVDAGYLNPAPPPVPAGGPSSAAIQSSGQSQPPSDVSS